MVDHLASAHLPEIAKGRKSCDSIRSIYEAIQKERVRLGDVVYIEANTGAVKRVGRSDAYATEFDLEAEEYVPIPKGDVHKKKEIVQDVTLHDLDVANATATRWTRYHEHDGSTDEAEED